MEYIPVNNAENMQSSAKNPTGFSRGSVNITDEESEEEEKPKHKYTRDPFFKPDQPQRCSICKIETSELSNLCSSCGSWYCAKCNIEANKKKVCLSCGDIWCEFISNVNREMVDVGIYEYMDGKLKKII